MKSPVVKVLAAFVAFILILAIANPLFKRLRLDLTEQSVYSLSDGTKAIIDKLEQPITLTLYYSDKASEDLTALRSYATRVKEVLEEYVILSDNKITLKIVDPEPFSENEDKASEFGLQAVPIATGDDIYFGMTAVNEKGDDAVITFFQPDKEAFLEYEISELVYRLGQAKEPVVGLASTLDIRGGFDMQRGQPTPPWMIYEQLDQMYDVRWIDESLETIDSDIELLVLVQPKALTEAAQYQLDQYVMKGGKLIVFVDPKAETATPDPAEAEAGVDDSLAPLLDAWGVAYDAQQVVTDAEYGLTVSMGQGRPPVRHAGLLGIQMESLNSEEISTADLENLNLASAGILAAAENATTSLSPLIWTSSIAQPVDLNRYNLMRDPSELLRDFQPTGENYTLAARINGPAKSAFDQKVGDGEEEHVKDNDNLNVLIIADTDLLTDRLWVQVQSFFGQRVAQPWADNGAFVNNLVEQFLGSSDLISIRSRGRFGRPFEVVQDLQREAETKFLESERQLQQELEQTEAKLAELEQQRDKESLTLSPEQEAALSAFQDEKLKIRKALRDVRHELDKEIDGLGSWLKLLNIAVFPLLLTLLVLGFAHLRIRRIG